MASESCSRLYRARKTCCEMLQDRKYIVAEQEIAETFHDFQIRFEQNERTRSRMLLIASHKANHNDRIIVYFADETKKTGVKPIRELSDKMEDRNIPKAILVTQNILTAFAKDAIAEAAPKHIIEYFLEAELLVSYIFISLVLLRAFSNRASANTFLSTVIVSTCLACMCLCVSVCTCA
eukprot:GHVQ01042536.1.p1 GENE.GHVQ01042536.1~~GHVQ01042536.1.p1  ORF type:complete len:179 (+),score=21.15 GHVQ01042536.1:133-669(+)